MTYQKTIKFLENLSLRFLFVQFFINMKSFFWTSQDTSANKIFKNFTFKSGNKIRFKTERKKAVASWTTCIWTKILEILNKNSWSSSQKRQTNSNFTFLISQELHSLFSFNIFFILSFPAILSPQTLSFNFLADSTHSHFPSISFVF